MDRLTELQDELKGKGFRDGISWTRPASIHLTLKFLGEVDEGRIEEIGRALEGAAFSTPPFTVTANRVGAFPSLKAPRVIWAGIEDSAELAALQKRIDEALSTLGFEPEQRAFRPHLTICRVKSPSEGRALGRTISETAPELDERWTAASFALYRSVLGSGGARYTVLKRIELTA